MSANPSIAIPSSQPVPVEFSTLVLEAPPQIPGETPLAERSLKCVFCWHERFPGIPYPEEWSSTICPPCETREYVKLAARRLRKQQARAQCPIPAASGEEVAG